MTASELAQLREFLSRDPQKPLEPKAPEPKPFDLADEARRIGAVGVIVWAWDPLVSALRPSTSFGYSPRVLAQLPNVGRNDDNATAAAFRSGKLCAVAGVDGATGALAAPIVEDLQTVGVLAVELPSGAEKNAAIRSAVASIASKVRLEDRYERFDRRRA